MRRRPPPGGEGLRRPQPDGGGVAASVPPRPLYPEYAASTSPETLWPPAPPVAADPPEATRAAPTETPGPPDEAPGGDPRGEPGGDPGPGGPGRTDDLASQVRRGLKWSFAGQAALRFGTFASTLVMARLLAPRDFGLYAVGAVVLAITASINDVGVEPTLTRWPGPLGPLIPTAWTMIMALTLVIFGAFWFLAPAFASLLHAPQGAGIIQLMSCALLINAAFVINSVVTAREFRQHVRTAALMAGMVVEISLTITLALSGFGAYSLAWGYVVSNLVTGAVLFFGTRVRFRPGFSWSVARTLANCGAPLAGAALVAVLVTNVDYLLVGVILGPAALGLYVLAWNVASWPVSLFSETAYNVTVPGFARLQHDPARLNDALSRSMGAMIGVTLPLFVLLAGLALPVIRFAYGAKWSGAAAPLRFLVAMSAIRVAAYIARDALVATGRGRTTFWLQGLWLVGLIALLPLGAVLWGIEGVGVGQVVVAAGIMAPAFLLALRRQGFGVAAFGRSLLRPLAGAGCVGAVVFGVSRLPLTPFAELALGGAVGMVMYLIVVWPIWQPLIPARIRALWTRTAVPV